MGHTSLFTYISLTETSPMATLEKRVPEKCTQRLYFLSERLLWRRNVKFGGLLAISAISHNVKCFYILLGICLFFSFFACTYICMGTDYWCSWPTFYLGAHTFSHQHLWPLCIYWHWSFYLLCFWKLCSSVYYFLNYICDCFWFII